MPRTIVLPPALDLVSPGRRDYWVALEHDSIWGEFHIPLTVIVGPQAKDGRGLVTFGSNHGNEYEGPVALKNLLSEIRTEDVPGRIILVPVLNPAAFQAGTRESTADDGVNLNRAFVENAGCVPALSGITHRIAKFVRQYIWPHVHVVIDLHSGGDVARFAPCASFHPLDDPEQHRAVEQTARWFGLPLVIIYQNQTPGLLPSEAESLGKITVGTELGWGASVAAVGVRHARQGVLAAAIHHGQLRGKIEPIGHHAASTQRLVAMVERECFVPAPWPGHYEPLVECGEVVRQGQTVGLLHDFYRIDEKPWPVVAGVDGIVIAQAWKVPVRQGQHILVVGKEMPFC
ncbi:MAG: succinylglutamate desuccinylase/aspartoacylase family protein [Planctomycetes bacterium]|nr:succinylglutamate desuccinylase/aspartoacylase family protein [Planctomycetota bacterium]